MNKITTYIIAAAALCAFCVTNPAQSLAADYPTAHNSRPLTLPGGVFTAGTDVNMTDKFEGMSMGINLGYGIIDDFDINIHWGGMALMPEFAVNKSTTIGLSYNVVKSADNSHSLAIALGTPLYVTDEKAFNDIGLGADYRWNVMGGKLSIHTGKRLFNIQLEGPEGEFAAQAVLDLGFAYQATDNLNIRMDFVNLVWLPLVGGGDMISVADATPIALTTTYAIDNTMDLGLMVTADAQAAGDTLALGLTFDWRML